MKTALRIMSIISIILGALAIVISASPDGTMGTFIGGALYMAEGILALVYIKQQ